MNVTQTREAVNNPQPCIGTIPNQFIHERQIKLLVNIQFVTNLINPKQPKQPGKGRSPPQKRSVCRLTDIMVNTGFSGQYNINIIIIITTHIMCGWFFLLSQNFIDAHSSTLHTHTHSPHSARSPFDPVGDERTTAKSITCPQSIGLPLGFQPTNRFLNIDGGCFQCLDAKRSFSACSPHASNTYIHTYIA